jgi:(E)-4-hydroxy-3-methylbut-2-enyl-diphosphate synthase
MEMAKKVTEYVEKYSIPLKIAVMGCVVNGPGEAKDCDIGIAGAEDYCVIFKGGEILHRVAQVDAEREFFKEIDTLING